MPRSRVLPVLLGLFGLVVLASPLTFGLAGIPGVSPPDAITDSGDTINRVYWVIYALAAIVFIVVEATLVLFIFRYRRRRPGAVADAEGPQIHGNTTVEVLWTVIPALLLLGLAIFTFSQVPDVEAKPTGDEDALVVDVTAHQFYWQYRYRDSGALSYDRLVLPVGRKISLVLRSADVDHSWWVPELTGKRDAIPGRTNELHFRTRRTASLDSGVCGEFCGIQHARMVFRVDVVPQGEFDSFISDTTPDAVDQIALGKEQWRAACAKCHGFEGQGDIGPAIAGNNTLTNLESLRQLLYEGQNLEANPGYMPPVGKGWTDEQIRTLIAYVKSNDKLAPPGDGGGQSGG